MNTRVFSALFLASLLASPAVLADKQGYYRWRDANGTLHFSQQPPVDRPYEFVRDDGARYLGQRPAPETSQTQNATQGLQPKATTEDKGDRMEALPPKDPERCAQAKQNLRTLDRKGVRIRSTDSQGNSRYLNQEELAEQRRRAEQAREVFCD